MNITCHEMIGYKQGLELQQMYWQARKDDKIEDTLLLLEHTPVVTFGVRKDGQKDLLWNEDQLKVSGIDIVKTDRGGLATLHAPGQLMGYFFIRMPDFPRGLRGLIRCIHESLVQSCAEFGVAAKPDCDEPGIWVHHEDGSRKKIASIGLSVKRGITRHGFGFNISTDLNLFNAINPCGHNASVMTRLQSESSKDCTIDDVIVSLSEIVPKVFEENCKN